MKKIILSLSLLFCLIFISIEAISIGQNSTQNTTKDNQIDLMGNITHKGTRTLIKPIVLMQSEGVLEASFVEKLGLITIEILDKTNNPISKYSTETDSHNYLEIITSNFKDGEYLIVFTNYLGYQLKGSFTIKK